MGLDQNSLLQNARGFWSFCKPAKCSAKLKLFTVISFQASRCVQELEVPHFYHELVYEVYIYNELASSLAHDILNKSKIEITDLWTQLICEKIVIFKWSCAALNIYVRALVSISHSFLC